MTQDLLTITGIAQKLGMPESTVRYYRNKFSDFIPMVGEGRKRRYKPETLEIISLIEKMFRENQTAIDIAKCLARKFPQNIEFEMQPQQVPQEIATTQQPQNIPLDLLHMVAGQTQALKHLALMLDKFYNHERELKTLSDEVVFLRKQLNGLKKNNKYDRELETLSDEVIFLRKKLANGYAHGNKAHEQDGLNKKIEKIINYLQQLEKKQVEAQENLSVKEQRILKLEKKLGKAHRPWWVRWLNL